MVTISKVINNYVLELSKEININKVILFGSYAKGTNHEDYFFESSTKLVVHLIKLDLLYADNYNGLKRNEGYYENCR